MSQNNMDRLALIFTPSSTLLQSRNLHRNPTTPQLPLNQQSRDLKNNEQCEYIFGSTRGGESVANLKPNPTILFSDSA